MLLTQVLIIVSEKGEIEELIWVGGFAFMCFILGFK